MKKLILIVSILTFTFTSNVFSQEVKADVTINVEQLEFEARTNVSNMERDIENYINNQIFTQREWEGDPIPVQMVIYLSGGSNHRYSAKMLLTSQRQLDANEEKFSVNLRFYEDNWTFEYGLGANLTYNPLRFDEFTSVIDYYMLIVIGFELDTWAELDGNTAFTAARRIVELGASHSAEGFSSNSAPGDFTKFNLTSELTNLRFNDFRKLWLDYYFDGLDLISYEPENAIENLKNTIYEMAVFKKDKVVESSVLLQLFFDSKAREIASIFNNSQDEDVFQNLKYLDPSNSTLYDDAKDGKLGN